MSYDSIDVANRFIAMAAGEDRKLTVMQVMKLVYIAHGWSLALLDKPLIEDDVEAWKYGPVIPRLYHAIKQYGSRPIDQEVGKPGFLSRFRVSDSTTISDDLTSIITQVYDIYGKLNGIQLSHLTHKAGTAWDQMYREGYRGVRIPNELTEAHYKDLANTPEKA